MKKNYFLTGISTEVGKTVVSAIIVEALQMDYWKPVQSGDLDNSDSMKIERWISNNKSVIHPEGVILHTPMSPHAAAEIDGVELNLSDFSLPKTDNSLLVEGAGGLLVPLNDEDCIIDLIADLGLEVILVSRHYLGSINHTLMSCEVLRKRNIPIKGIVFSGDPHPTTESVIEKMSGLPVLFRLQELEAVNQETIYREAVRVRTTLLDLDG